MAPPPLDPPLDPAGFPVTRQLRFFNNAGVAALPTVAVEAINRCAADFAAGGSQALATWDRQQEDVRRAGARLLGVEPDLVALVKNTTEALSFVANGLAWAPGDRVIVPDGEFPSTVFPWLSLRDRGVVVDRLQPVGTVGALPLERFAEMLRARPTRLVAVSWVQFGRGHRVDLAALASLCHEHGALLCVDAIQGVGVIPARFAEWGVDFAACGGHKWLLSAAGAGLLYVARPQLHEVRPPEPGWNAAADRDRYDTTALDLDPTARRFEGGSADNLTLAALGASIDLLLGAGVDAVWQHVDRLNERLVAGLAEARIEVLSDRSPEGRAGIVAVGTGDLAPAQVADELRAAGFVVAARGGAVRVSPHGYATDDDVDALLASLRALSSR